MARDLFSLFGERNKLPLSYEQRLGSLAERRRFAKMLREQAMAQPIDNGKMVSGHYVANPWEGLVNVAQAFMAKRDLEAADKEEADLVSQRQADFERAIGEMPQDRPGESIPGAPGEAEAPTVVPPQQAGPQDWMKWGGRMSTLGPQGQAIGQAAINAGLQRVLPKLPTPKPYEWKTIDLPGGMKQNAYVTGDPANPFIPVGPAFKAEPKDKNPTQLEQRLEYSTEINQIRRRAVDEGRQLTPTEADRIGSLTTALNQMAAVATDGGVAAVDRTQLANPGAAPGGAPQQPPSPVSVGTDADRLASRQAIPPNVQADRDRAALQMKQAELSAAKPGTPEHAALQTEIKQTEDAIRRSEAAAAKPAPGQPAVTAGATKNVDPYTEYRQGGAKYDPRNEPYLPQPTQPGVTMARPGTGAQQRLNTDVSKLADDVAKQQIDTFEDAWKDFRLTFAAARAKVAGLNPSGRSLLEQGWDKLRFGGGAGGPAGIYNSLPQFLNTPAGQDLKRSIERIKAFERHRLFGATLTGNEKVSFEALAGTQFGVGDEQLLNAMGAMERQFEEAKRSVYGGYAPIVVDEFRRSRQSNAQGQPSGRPWKMNRERYGTGGVDG